MDDKDIPVTALNPWHPESDPVKLKHLGKLGEEAGELGSAACRCIIQGIEEKDPTKDKTNREWLEDEMGDTIGNIRLNIALFGLDADRIEKRAQAKMNALAQWHAMASLVTHYGLFREHVPESPMIKEAQFFREQGGMTEDWGKKWEPIHNARSCGEARRIFAAKYGVNLSPIYRDEQ